MSISRDTGGINNNTSQSTGVSRTTPGRLLPPDKVGTTPGRLLPPGKVGTTPSGLLPPGKVGTTPRSQSGITPKSQNGLLPPGVHQMNLVKTPNIQTTTSRMRDTAVTEKTSRSTRRWIYWTII